LSYGTLSIFIASLGVFFVYSALFTPLGAGGFVAAAVTAVVEMIVLSILRSLYSTRYVLTRMELAIVTTRLIGGNKRISIDTVESVENTLIPFGIRLFGASFHGGYYKIPGLGRAFLAITNYNDGLLIRSKQGNYIITPRDPREFKKTLETFIEKGSKRLNLS